MLAVSQRQKEVVSEARSHEDPTYSVDVEREKLVRLLVSSPAKALLIPSRLVSNLSRASFLDLIRAGTGPSVNPLIKA